MAKKRKRRAKRKKTTTKKKKQSIEWVLTGIVLVLVAVLSCVHFGLFSQQLINLIRFFVGDSHYLASIILGLFGLIMVIYNQPPHFSLKRGSGLGIFYLGLLLWESARVFNQMMIHQGFLNAFLTSIGEEFARAQITTKVGGGLIGSILYQFIFPILGTIGAEALSFLMMLVGILMICNVKFATLLSGFQKGSQLVIEKNKDAGVAIKSKYDDLVEKHEQNKQEKLNNREKLMDPLDDRDETFPSTADFTSDSFSTKTKKNDKEDNVPHFEPQIEVSQDNASTLEPEVHDSLTENLPISHSYAEEDQKMKQELQNVDHGDLETKQGTQTKNANYKKPPINLLAPIKNVDQSQDKALIQKNTEVLESTFKSFGVHVIVKKAVLGPTVTRYEVQPAVGVKVSKIVNLADDLALALAAKDIRIEAPIPGKPLIGIEVPNRTTSAVSFKDVMIHQDPKAKDLSLDVPLGKDVEGKVISADLRKMPHLLIAGSTGSGKSVAINTIITSILMKSYPEDVKLVLIDPKMVELSVYNGIPHLLIPVVTDAKLATNALRKTVKEMERRYQLFATGGVRNITEYNQKVAENNADKNNSVMEKLPYIVVIVDELSDLMMVAGHDVEDAIVRLAQMARAAGIHMILATQRPSVDVITGLIKANVPSRISFAVSSGVDSRTILDQVGAEKLLGRGDMLFLPIGAAKPERVQGAFISVTEVEKIVSWVKEQQEAVYNEDMIPSKNDSDSQTNDDDEPGDEFYDQAVALVRKQQSASVSMLQRRFRIGYNRAARIVDAMEAKGIVGPSEGSKPRQVLIPPEKDDEK
ncbi:cell division protein FtsK [Lactobacillus taiwanensis]|uniref:FtsK/SpoIIIE family DNA translocase n=1 Tax=Lactobacillus taiwanensis TaxID=508451 RepID=UPI000B992EC8|nr:DNA translocase FtsK [Lactobacillus taiwanensis]OYS19336.1 cell division protein FtsK [Lactobacillus taiwanensis]OYS22468.1 cell division protein FtsK [Lactobacillus taiwanensis]OYS23768.1 cell division protein FtsK [Lactobacillus taiwanensis]OYS26080.1 cell division protein FtsK [Lactobacillus taiwanensis]OYS27510.1 cell division protein FtsK [Lactobacillus taiwanensis]